MAKLLLEDCGDPEKIKAHRETKRFISGCQRLGREFGGWCFGKWTQGTFRKMRNSLYVDCGVKYLYIFQNSFNCTLKMDEFYSVFVCTYTCINSTFS